MIRIGIIGYGYWGPNLVRNFQIQKGCKIEAVADSNPNRLKLLSQTYPSIKAVENADEIIVMQKGEIIERGTHESLIASNGFYKKLVEMQEIN